jgi:hypothetical protein
VNEKVKRNSSKGLKWIQPREQSGAGERPGGEREQTVKNRKNILIKE